MSTDPTLEALRPTRQAADAMACLFQFGQQSSTNVPGRTSQQNAFHAAAPRFCGGVYFFKYSLRRSFRAVLVEDM